MNDITSSESGVSTNAIEISNISLAFSSLMTSIYVYTLLENGIESTCMCMVSYYLLKAVHKSCIYEFFINLRMKAALVNAENTVACGPPKLLSISLS